MMRRAAVVSLLAALSPCHAQQDALGKCLDQLTADARFAPIARKLTVGTVPFAPPPVAIDTTYPDKRELQAIGEWAAARGECVKAANRFGNATYRPPLQAIGIEAENRVLAATEVLYNRKMTWGEFNRERQAIAVEQGARVAAFRQRVQSQQAAQEQSARQAREREQLQKAIEETERLTSATQEQTAQARQRQEDALRRAAGARGNRPYPSLPPPSPRTYRDCFAFDNRIVCTR